MKNIYALLILLISVFGCKNNEEKFDLPTYEVADRITQINGRVFIDIIIPEFSKETQKGHLEEVIKQICNKERANDASVYCSKEAMKSNYSSSFSEANPNASNCFLVRYENGSFLW